MHTRRPPKSLGYTLVEAIVVLVVIGILSTALFARTDAVTKRSVPDQADLLRRDLRHIQSLALTFGIALRLNISSNGYNVTCLANVSPCAIAGGILIDPTSGQLFSIVLPTGVTMTAVNSLNAAAYTVDFDSIGRPIFSGTLIKDNPARTFSLSGASKTSNVYLRPITGFAEVSY